jgi:hypothetical protein
MFCCTAAKSGRVAAIISTHVVETHRPMGGRMIYDNSPVRLTQSQITIIQA